MEQCERLRQYNRWRRGEEDWSADDRGPDPKELGELIDGVADRLEVLEREHQQFFDRWHEERRRRERLAADVDRCYRMLLSEPDTKGALFKAENILREAIADASAKPHNVEFSGGAAFAPSAGTQGYAVAVQRPTCCEVGQKLGISVCDKCANEGADYQSLLGPRDRNEEPGA